MSQVCTYTKLLHWRHARTPAILQIWVQAPCRIRHILHKRQSWLTDGLPQRPGAVRCCHTDLWPPGWGADLAAPAGPLQSRSRLPSGKPAFQAAQHTKYHAAVHYRTPCKPFCSCASGAVSVRLMIASLTARTFHATKRPDH